MILSFLVIMSPWWIRNYMQYNMFIPLAESGGNPLLQGTYIGYKQTPENIVYYKLGKNAVETNKSEIETAKKRIAEGFKKDFWGYLKWYTIDKTLLLWGTVFYWREYAGISFYDIIPFHFLIIAGFLIIPFVLFKNFKKYALPVSILAYFNVVYCVYMSFDRYAFPLLPILSVFSSSLIYTLLTKIKLIEK